MVTAPPEALRLKVAPFEPFQSPASSLAVIGGPCGAGGRAGASGNFLHG